jgi:hypothetical protein
MNTEVVQQTNGGTDDRAEAKISGIILIATSLMAMFAITHHPHPRRMKPAS